MSKEPHRHGSSRATGAAYPAHLEFDVLLRDGSTVHLRPVRSGDEEALLALFQGLSLESRTFRFFSAGADLKRTARLMAKVDYVGHYGLVASRGEGEKLLAHATYIEASTGRAEVAFAVVDELQGLGLATLMLAHLAEVARANGIASFFAEVLPENHHMVEVFEDSGFSVSVHRAPDAIRFDFPTGPMPAAIERFAKRGHLPSSTEPSSVLTADGTHRRQP
jgi:acetate---CoA ligase (ADP-forming)